MATKITVDAEALHAQVQIKYREVALSPEKGFHFQTGRSLAERLGYPRDALDRLPTQCVESFAGVGNPFSLGPIHPGESVADVGSGAGFDSLMAGELVGEGGSVIGVDMTPEMLRKARRNAGLMGASNVTFRDGMAEKLPVDDSSADVVISNGVVNLVPVKKRVLAEMLRVLVPGGRLYLSDIIVHKPVPDSAKADIDLWTD